MSGGSIRVGSEDLGCTAFSSDGIDGLQQRPLIAGSKIYKDIRAVIFLLYTDSSHAKSRRTEYSFCV